jgi:GTP-dependent phosphoenolpyruvate carboxykinase
MTAATVPGLDDAPTEHERLLAWVREVAELTEPDRVAFADGSNCRQNCRQTARSSLLKPEFSLVELRGLEPLL